MFHTVTVGKVFEKWRARSDGPMASHCVIHQETIGWKILQWRWQKLQSLCLQQHTLFRATVFTTITPNIYWKKSIRIWWPCTFLGSVRAQYTCCSVKYFLNLQTTQIFSCGKRGIKCHSYLMGNGSWFSDSMRTPLGPVQGKSNKRPAMWHVVWREGLSSETDPAVQIHQRKKSYVTASCKTVSEYLPSYRVDWQTPNENFVGIIHRLNLVI